ncbi:hypothetical protein LEP1GSC074_3737 [Leptospira noguchii str. Hook]|nr:hypothetical protein LEP1GSC041_2286 [Leptospira noguchii str. 2006001870]EMS84314.1 hypothetical protein LEP1GSC074_3737 [Leptospira noguchii str. Hook]
MICCNSRILEKNLQVRIPIFFRKINRGFPQEPKLKYKFVRVPTD